MRGRSIPRARAVPGREYAGCPWRCTVFCKSPFCTGFDGIDLPEGLPIRTVGADEVSKQDNQTFVHAVGIIAIDFEPRYQGRQAFRQIGFDRVQGLEELRVFTLWVCKIVEKLILPRDHIVKDGGGKFLFEKTERTRAPSPFGMRQE